jgi:hypothetical protein
MIALMGEGFKMIESAERRWRTVNAPHLVALVRVLTISQLPTTRHNNILPAKTNPCTIGVYFLGGNLSGSLIPLKI